jgi:hypothetical protein
MRRWQQTRVPHQLANPLVIDPRPFCVFFVRGIFLAPRLPPWPAPKERNRRSVRLQVADYFESGLFKLKRLGPPAAVGYVKRDRQNKKTASPDSGNPSGWTGRDRCTP